MRHLTLLPKLSRRGENVARPSTSGTMLMTMPENARLGRQPDLVQKLAARVVHAARRHVGQHLNSRTRHHGSANRGPVK